MADIFYTDATYIDDAPYTWRPDRETTPRPARAHRRLRNWQKFVMCYALILAGVALLLHDVVLRTGGNAAGGLVVAAGVVVVGTLAGLVILIMAWRMDRL